ncbi:MAG TPA: DUF3467 domain-containing protein [Candidatus Acidoferrales bacterium]
MAEQPVKIIADQDLRKMTIQAPGMPTVYYNHARIAAGYFDVRVFLGNGSVLPTGEPTFTEEVCIVMSPEFAKMFTELLAAQLNPYESLFGKIRPIPEGANLPIPANTKF